MNLIDFDYDLPARLIAQVPPPEREGARLMVLHRTSQLIEHKRVPDVVGYLRKGDALVLNDSKVIPARLLGASPRPWPRPSGTDQTNSNRKAGLAPRRAATSLEESGSEGEVLLLEERATNLWECLVRPGKKFRLGAQIFFKDHDLVGEVVGETPFRGRIVRFQCEGNVRDRLDEIGCVPLPPYIRRKEVLPVDRDRYQTVYASKEGSVAAPTAGFHLTERLLTEIRRKGVAVCFVTLHVGLGTFQPVRAHQIERHRMHAEWFSIDAKAAGMVNRTERGTGRLVAVGTTSARALEAAADEDGPIRPLRGKTELFIYPGYKFKVLGNGALLTNFHLPRSTLLMLVCAFAGRDFILKAYREAIQMEYRFYSYGDAMLIL